MKRSIVWLLVIILMLSHLIPPDYVTFAEETEDECKVSEFSIQNIAVGDEAIKGTGLSGQILEIEFINEGKKDTIQVADNGEFEYDLETVMLVENDKVKISNDYYKIETYVTAEGTLSDQIKSEQYVECSVEVTPEEASAESIETESQPEEPMEEASAESIETDEQTNETPEGKVESEGEITETFSVLSQDQTQSIYQSSSAPIDTIQGTSVTVSTSQQFIDALSNNDIEHIRLSNNIYTSGTLDVRTRYDQKVIDANGYSINVGSGQMELSSSSTLNRDVRKLIILNATNLYTSNTSNNGGMIKKTVDEVSIHLENINFNATNDYSGGILGSSWEGNINFYGNNIINTYNGGFSMAFRKVFIHQGAQVEINNYNGSSVFQFERNSRAYGDGEYGIQVDTNGVLNVNSNGAVMTSNLSRTLLRDRILTNRFGIDSDVVLNGHGSNIFPIDTTVNNFIANPEKVDLINNQSNGALFSSNEDINFYLSETTLKGWNGGDMEDQPSNISQPITTGQFRFSENDTTNVSLTPEQPNFSTMFTPQLRRMKFEKPVPPIDVLEVADITDNATEITGTTSANVSVTMFDGNGNVIQIVESDSNGEFSFKLEVPFEVDTILKFQAQSDYVKSEIVEKTVTGNRLELIGVPDSIPFESTEIRDKEMIISRKNSYMSVSVMDTRSNSDWHLTVKALAPLTDSAGNHTLDDALYYIKDDREQLIENEAARVGEKNQSSNSNIQELNWGANEGILLKLNPVQAQAETEYSTTIEWTLTDGP